MYYAFEMTITINIINISIDNLIYMNNAYGENITKITSKKELPAYEHAEDRGESKEV